MKKTIKFFLLSAFICATQFTQAQFSVSLGGGMMKWEDIDAQLGPQLGINYQIENIRIGANLGYYTKSDDFFGTKLSIISFPIALSGEYAFSDNAFSPYIGADFGIFRFGFGGDGEREFGDAALNLAPKAGFNFSFSDDWAINAHGKYHVIMSDGESSNAISFNLGIVKSF